MYVGYLVFSVLIIIFAVGMMLVSRPRKSLEKQHLGVWSSVLLIGIAILLRGYDVIPSLAGWTLVGIAIVLFWTLFYDMFFRGEERSNSTKRK